MKYPGLVTGLAKRLCPEANKWPDCAENRLLLDLLKWLLQSGH